MNYFDRLQGRRTFLERAVWGVGLLTLGGLGTSPGAQETEHMAGASKSPEPSADFHPDVELELSAVVDTAQMLPGEPTTVWRYVGKVLKGDPGAFSTLPDSSVPVIRVRNGQRIRIFFYNHLREDTIVHWHGLHIVQKMDGHPMYAIAPGRRYVYEWVIDNRAGTYWFHPHPHGRTGIQVYAGLSGLFIVEDDEEAQAGLPSGEFERSWVIQDRRFTQSNQLSYVGNHMDMMMGFVGDRILVNGQVEHVEKVAATAYRVRILNGSNARFYKLAWSDGRPLTVIGADGGLLEQPVEKPYVMIAPAERVELWLNFSDDEIGSERVLRSLEFSGGGMMGMGRGRGMGGGSANSNGDAFDVLKVRVVQSGSRARALPATLSTVPWPRLEDAVNGDAPRTVRLQMGRGQVALNGRTFDMMSVTPEEIVKLGTTEVWEFVNESGPMAHPMHIHNLQFKVVSRRQDSRLTSIYDTMNAGLVDEGWKDVVIVMPGERVRVLMRFEDFEGLYLYHCHILEHEDLGMMRNYRVDA